MKAYEDDVLGGNFKAAWALLSKSNQIGWGTFEKYQSNRAAFLAGTGLKYDEELDPPNTLTISQWIEGHNWTAIDPAKAHLVSVHWNGFSDPTSGWEIFIVMPVKTGWALYQAR